MTVKLMVQLLQMLYYMTLNILRNDVDTNHIFIDKCKLDRAKAQIKIVSESKDLEEKKNHLICLGVGDKLDQTTQTSRIINSPEGELLKNLLNMNITPEHHLTFTYEHGKSTATYLTHIKIPIIGATGLVLAKEMCSVLQEFNSVESIQAVLLDNTATNKGPIKGLVVKLEELLKRKLHLIGCALHQSELPLKAFLKKLDGMTTGLGSFFQ